MDAENIEYFDPESIIADNNIRMSLNAGALELLMRDIQEQGGVQEPVTAELVNNKLHLRKGFRRHAAVTALNAKGAGLKLPVIVREYSDDKARLRAQIAENVVRESLSPIDTALSMQKMLDQGFSKVEIRDVFARATPKGAKPLSNAMVNIYLNMLQLPKGIQSKIHDGRVSVRAAYELSKVPADKREEVLRKAEAAMEAELAAEEKEENKFLATVAKEEKAAQREKDAAEKAAKLDADVKAARAKDHDAVKLVKTRAAELDKLEKAKPKRSEFVKLPVEEQKKINEGIKAAEASLKGAQKERQKTSGELAKLVGKQKSIKEKAEEVEETPAAAPKAAKSVTDAHIKGAAKETTGSGSVALTLSDLRVAFRDIGKAATPRVQKIGVALQALYLGTRTTKETIHDLGVIVGEVKAAK